MGARKLLVLGIVALAGGAVALSSFSHTETLSLTREVFLEKGYVPQPKVIARTHDNGLIVAGSNFGQAWVIKSDAEGRFKWRHTVPGKLTHPNPYTDNPTYISVGVMADDSILLCGSMPGFETGNGLLTHLDKDGKVLSEQTGVKGGVVSCLASDDGVIELGLNAVNKPVQPTPSHPQSYDSKVFYWIIAFDVNGKIKWEKREPISDRLGGTDYISPLQILADGGFAFAARRNGVDTEVVRVKSNGDVAAKRLLGDGYIIALPTQPETDLQFVSLAYRAPLTRITLNSDLQETGRVTGDKGTFRLRIAYRLPDQSLVLFGTMAPAPFGTAGVMKLDSALRHPQTINLSPKDDSYWVEAAAPLSQREFVSARGAMDKHARSDGRPPPNNIGLGVALDFVTLK